MNLNDAELAALGAGVYSISAFFRLETSPVIRLWLGFGNIIAPGNVLDVGSETYQGFGEITDLPEFTQMINGAAERVEFTISGVSGDILQLAMNDADAVKGKRVSVGVGFLDPSAGDLLGDVHWLANYRADVLAIRQGVSTNGEMPIRVVTLSCGTLLTSRRRPALSYFSNEDQQARFPGDTFCEHTPKYANHFNKKWPTFP